jgi:hypothetical protein
MSTDKIALNMEVIGADGVHIGTVAAVADGRIRLSTRESGEGARKDHSHFIDLGLVAISRVRKFVCRRMPRSP